MSKARLIFGMMLIISLMAAGCSNNQDVVNESDSAPEEVAGVIELDMWIHQSGEGETNYNLDRVAAFNEVHESEIHINVEVVMDDGGSSYNDSLNAALVAGNLPDVLALDGPFVASYAEADIIAPVTEFISEEDRADFVDSIIEQGTYNGELYSLGAMESSVVLYYNKEIFEAEGIEAPTTIEEAWTWDEFMAAAKQLTTDDRYGLNLFMDYGVGEWYTYMGAPFVWSNGGSLISEDGTTVDGYLNGPESVEALEFVKSLFEEGVVSLTPSETQFESGKAAMALGGPWIGLSAENAGLDYGMMPYPYSEVPKSPSGSMAYAVSSQAEHPEAAYKVMQWMTNEESTIGLSKVTGMPPARKSAFENMESYNELPKKVMRDQVVNTAHARPTTPAYPVLTDAFAQALHAAALGEDPQEVLDQQVQRVERELRRFNK
ncbi:ABC transporter substrate-binding protein [Alkalihalophilus lindianensis]|uniref:ABC transporter substrate-binding protein n=1 Tax=Alkalihalophilus lindianensis TaxID=1630542 RepID=A0ABU3XE52_9BACI|nr:ABC transporter substrate-binding protein [Alkalihalophilus lindianensis]MDV2686169.1 ABC transporter substrate-binding protein [Alkalihalophilus lindianensis]